MHKFARLTSTLGLLMVIGAVSYLWWIGRGTSSNQTPIPTLVEKNKFKLISAQFLAEDCSIQIQTSDDPIIIKTDFEPGVSKCEDFSIVLPSPSGQIVAFEDLSAGIDSWLKIYSAEHQTTIGVEVLGTSSILGMTFLPDDRLAVLHGYGLTGEQWLRIYDLPGLIANYPENAVQTTKKTDAEINKFNETAVSQATSILDLPPVKENYHYIQLDGNELKLFGSKGIKSKVLAKFDLASI